MNPLRPYFDGEFGPVAKGRAAGGYLCFRARLLATLLRQCLVLARSNGSISDIAILPAGGAFGGHVSAVAFHQIEVSEGVHLRLAWLMLGPQQALHIPPKEGFILHRSSGAAAVVGAAPPALYGGGCVGVRPGGRREEIAVT